MIEVGAQAVAVATAVFAGNRGGLPLTSAKPAGDRPGRHAGGRAAFVRLLAGSPAIGAGLLAVVAALIVWALVTPNVVLGVLLPTLVALGIALGYVVLNFATAALEPNLDRLKPIVGAALLIVVPLLVLLAGLFERLGVDGWANVFTVLFAAGAVGAAVARILVELFSKPLGWRRRVLGVYRLFVVGALVSYGVGLVLEPLQEESEPKAGCDPLNPCDGFDWASVADEQAGLILFGALLAAALIAAILVELLPRRRPKKKARSTAATPWRTSFTVTSRGPRLSISSRSSSSPGLRVASSLARSAAESIGTSSAAMITSPTARSASSPGPPG